MPTLRFPEMLRGDTALLPGLPDPVEKEAQRIAAQLLTSFSEPFVEIRKGGKQDWRMVDVYAAADTRPRRISVPHIGLWALEQLGFEKLLQDLGVSGPLRQAAVGSVIVAWRNRDRSAPRTRGLPSAARWAN